MKQHFPIIIALGFLVCGIFSSCGSEDDVPTVEPDDFTLPLASTLSASENDAVKSLNAFNDKFFANACRSGMEKGTVVVSPLSASMFLSMLTNAVEDNCEQEIIATLGMTDIKDLNAANRKILETIPVLSQKVEVNIANGVWYDDALSLRTEFSDMASSDYLADVTPCGLLSTSQATMSNINRWASSRTNGLIPNVLSSPISVEFLLMNVVSFKGEWESSFEQTKNESGVFHSAKGEQQAVMMTQKEKLIAIGKKDFTAVVKPFGGGDFKAVFALPDEGLEPYELIGSGALDNIMAADFKPYEVTLTMPKFKIQQNEAVDLAKIFKDMGLPDLERLSGSRLFNRQGDVRVSMGQTLAIEFNEKGAVASAASTSGETAIITSGAIDFRLDRPFVFYIFENSTGLCLFAGMVMTI